jgi:hypothetical protein
MGHLFLLFSFAVSTLTYDDVVFGVWSGREYTSRRVVSQAGSWYQLVPEIHLYSDDFVDDTIDLVLNESSRTNIVFHPFGHKGGHLMGTEWTHRWYYAQTRHLLTMADLYERFPDKLWYIWCDDDTYLYPDSIIEFLSSQNASLLQIHGVIYCAWDSVASIIEPVRGCHPFAQGGAGVFITGTLMQAIAPYLRNCSEIFNDANFAGSMRLAICIERSLGVENWNRDENAVPLDGPLHSSNPLTETEMGVHRPLSFHRMRHFLLYQIWNATESIWEDGTGRDRHVNWDKITMQTMHITIGNDRKQMLLHWGFRMRFSFTTQTYLYAISRPEPIFGSGDSAKVTPIMYEQSFEGGIVLRYICDDSLESGEMLLDSYFGAEKEGSVFRLYCPSSKYFPNLNRTSSLPRILERDPDMLNV